MGTGASSNMELAGILVVDDHPVMLDALCLALQNKYPCRQIFRSKTEQQAKTFLDSENIGFVLLDLFLDHSDSNEALQVLESLIKRHPEVRFSVITGANPSDFASQALAKGACGFLVKSMDSEQLLQAIDLMLEGMVYAPTYEFTQKPVGPGSSAMPPLPVKLTRRQLQIIDQLLLGHSNKTIAKNIGVGEQTVKSYVTSIMGALQVDNRTKIVVAINRLDRIYPGWRHKVDVDVADGFRVDELA